MRPQPSPRELTTFRDAWHTRILTAIRIGDLKKLQSYLPEDEPRINELSPDGHHILMEAVKSGHSDIVQWLLQKQTFIDVNRINRYTKPSGRRVGDTPLTMAVKENQLEICKLLLEAPNIKINAVDEVNGDTPLNLAVWHGRIEMVDLLLTKQEIDVNEPGDGSHDAYTPLISAVVQMSAAEEQEASASSQEDKALAASKAETAFKIMALLLQKGKALGLKINYLDEDNKTALCYALMRQNKKAIHLLRWYGAFHLTKGQTIRNYHMALVPEYHLLCPGYHTALTGSALYSANALLDPFITSELTALLESDQPAAEAFEKILPRWNNLLPQVQQLYLDTGLLSICGFRQYNASLLAHLLERGANPNTVVSTHENALDLDVWSVGLMNITLCGQTPLTALVGNTRLTQEHTEQGITALMKYGADINAKNTEGDTPLVRAALCSNLPATRVLSQHRPTVGLKEALEAAHEKDSTQKSWEIVQIIFDLQQQRVEASRRHQNRY